MLVICGGCVCQAPGAALPGSGGSSGALLLAGSFPTTPARQDPAASATGMGLLQVPPSLCSWKVLVDLFEPAALPEAQNNSAELASGPCDTTVTHNPLEGSAFSGGMESHQACLPQAWGPSRIPFHLPETVVGIQSPFLSLASQHGALQSMWG